MNDKTGIIILIAFWFITGIATYFIMIRKDKYKHLKSNKGLLFMAFFGVIVGGVLLGEHNKKTEKRLRKERLW